MCQAEVGSLSSFPLEDKRIIDAVNFLTIKYRMIQVLKAVRWLFYHDPKVDNQIMSRINHI